VASPWRLKYYPSFNRVRENFQENAWKQAKGGWEGGLPRNMLNRARESGVGEADLLPKNAGGLYLMNLRGGGLVGERGVGGST